MAIVNGAQETRRGPANGYFIWSVVLLLLAGLCAASWIGSFYIVRNPENPRCYRILKKFNRVDPPKRFPVTDAPHGEFLSATRLLERYGRLGKVELEQQNALLLRDYLMNYRESQQRVPYLSGRFEVIQSHALGSGDLFPSGAVAVAQAENYQQVFVEYIFPAGPENVARILETVTTGADIVLQRSHDLWALIHVERRGNDTMQFTVVPLPYGGWQLRKGQGNFTLQSPAELLRDHGVDLDLAAGLPIVREPRFSEGLAAHKQFRRKLLASAGDDQAALAGPELVRFEPKAIERQAVAGDGAASGIGTPVAPTEENATEMRPAPRPTPAPAVPLPPRPIVLSPPQRTGPIGAMPSTAATPPPPRPAPIAAPAEHAASSRVLSTAQASRLVERFPGDEPAVLCGDFVVTGVHGQRVALRTRESLRDREADPRRPGSDAVLVVVDFPDGVPVPAKDATLTRDAEHGFAIRDVIRMHDGQIAIVGAERIAP